MTQSERREKSRAAILEAALAEFGERGYAAASVDGVCARGGISKGLMYHYYKGKDELFCECVRAMFAALAEHRGGGAALRLFPEPGALFRRQPRYACRV